MTLDQALDTAAQALAGYACRHKPPCNCTRERLTALVGDLPSGPSQPAPAAQGGTHYPDPEAVTQGPT